MKRILFTFLWTIVGYLAGAVAIGFLSGMIFFLLISFGIELQDHRMLIRAISMGGVAAVTIAFLVLALLQRLPGTRRISPLR